MAEVRRLCGDATDVGLNGHCAAGHLGPEPLMGRGVLVHGDHRVIEAIDGPVPGALVPDIAR